MQKWLTLLFLAVLDVFLLSTLKDVVSVKEWKEAGIPITEMERADVSREDVELYMNFWKDLRYFPVAAQKGVKTKFSFQDTWLQERTYGGTRKHEGCDIFGKNMEPGCYPVISITDGIVENVGWLPLGGWRIGIRSPGGGYFYYAHLHEYAKEFHPGDSVLAGEILGLLGDSGYGDEGTRGKFVPHLHIGVYTEKDGEEYALNPFPMLIYLKKYVKEISY